MRQKLGQHFLVNRSAVKKIVAALSLRPNDTVIEIGPGRGALTFPLAAECQKIGCEIIGIEKDPQLARNLESGIRNYGNIKILPGDALKLLTSIIRDSSFTIQNYKIVGNIPYYITGKLLRILSAASLERGEPRPENSGREPKMTLAILMLQKEVTERIIAKPPKMNLLAAAVQFWAEAKMLFTLKPKDFNPPPKVESAVIQLTTYNQRLTTEFTNHYYQLIKTLFKQPRKTIPNNLKELKLPKNEIENALKAAKIDPAGRPQNLSVDKIRELADYIQF